jgi:hypothetical protein
MQNTTIARLESRIDMLETEITYLNRLLVDCGFPEGITTLKETALELLQENGGPFEVKQTSF